MSGAAPSKLCTLCSKADAVLECEEDAARLCAACDELVGGGTAASRAFF